MLLCSFGFDLLSFCQTEIKPRPAMTAAEYQKLHNAYRECLNPFSMAITDAFVFLGFKEHQEVFFFSLIMIKIMLHMQRADCNGIIIHVQPNFLYLKKVLVTLWWESKYWKCSHEHEMPLLLFYACIQYNSAKVITLGTMRPPHFWNTRIMVTLLWHVYHMIFTSTNIFSFII